VYDALFGEVLHHAPRGQLVILGVFQEARDGLEGFNEFGKVGELVKRLGFCRTHGRGVVPRAELGQRGRRDSAFEVQVQLGLGQAADELPDFDHAFSVAVLAKQRAREPGVRLGPRFRNLSWRPPRKITHCKA